MEKFEDVRNTFNKQKEVLETPPLDILSTLIFNESTKWTDDTLPKMLIEYGKHCPFGIEDLHKKGITGKGVTVAIIDQPLALNHPEYDGKILHYKDFCKDGGISSMHGPAVTSLLVGNTIGVAPGAKVVYAACPTWTANSKYPVKAFDWIMEVNKTLPESEKIKFISVSAAFGEKKLFKKHSKLWLINVKEVQESGVCVVECTEGNRFVGAGYVDFETKEFVYGFPDRRMRCKQVGEVHVPNSLRTVAESYDNNNFSYTYCGHGGLSWGIPFAVGTLCLGQQVAPKKTAFELKQALIDTAAENECIINPKKFIAKVKEKELTK